MLVSSFFSFLFLSNKNSLLASVPEFNCRCFLRSRCSMELWCPDDDVGRDSCVWVGPPTGESTPRSEVGAPPLLKRSLPRLDYCNCSCSSSCRRRRRCCCCCSDDSMSVCMSTAPQFINWQTHWSPRALTAVSARKLEKLALNSGTTGGARKMTQNASKRPHHRRHNASYQSLLHNKMSTTLAVN